MRDEPPGWASRRAPSLGDFEHVAATCLDELPATFRNLVGEVHLRITEFPDQDVVSELGAETQFDILGLFQGIGMAQDSSVPHSGQLPNMIWLYRRPILEYWAERDETLGAVIRHVLVHEIGHHFGLSDDDMEAIEAAVGERSGA